MTLEHDPERAAALCREAQARLLESVAELTDPDMGRASRLPGWSVGHVLTHLARNADAHARRLDGALRGVDIPKYQHGEDQRRGEIDAGAGRPASEVITDLAASQARLEEMFTQNAEAGWPNGHFLGGGNYGVAGCPAHRLREVEMHRVDLGLGYTAQHWSAEYVVWDLPLLLASAADRLGSPTEQRTFMAWLAGRGPLDPETNLRPW